VKSARPEALTIEIPLLFKKRGGRKQMIAPDGSFAAAAAAGATSTKGSNATIVRALARAHRWKNILESGSFDSISELAEAENVNRSYLCRMLRLTLLSPEITTRIFDANSGEIGLNRLMQPFSARWDQQQPLFN
jgi:hypothetical protein